MSDAIDFKEAAGSGANRARQFMPFMALKGYFDLCHERERVPQPRHELTEEEARDLSQTIAALRKGDMVRVTYYDGAAYVPCQGVLTEVVPELRYLRIVRKRIDFTDIRSIELAR